MQKILRSPSDYSLLNKHRHNNDDRRRSVVVFHRICVKPIAGKSVRGSLEECACGALPGSAGPGVVDIWVVFCHGARFCVCNIPGQTTCSTFLNDSWYCDEFASVARSRLRGWGAFTQLAAIRTALYECAGAAVAHIAVVRTPIDRYARGRECNGMCFPTRLCTTAVFCECAEGEGARHAPRVRRRAGGTT